MATPEFIVRLREKIGHDQLWLPGVSVVIFDPVGRVLLGRRSDTGAWAIISGIPEPGEQPAAAALRECEEEAGIRPQLLGITQVFAEDPMVFINGDQCVFMSIDFVARANAEQTAAAHVGDEESTAIAWFDPAALPEPLARSVRPRIAAAQAWLTTGHTGFDAAA